MKAGTGITNQVMKETLRMKISVKLRFGIIVAFVAGCLLAAPSTRDSKHNSEQINPA